MSSGDIRPNNRIRCDSHPVPDSDGAGDDGACRDVDTIADDWAAALSASARPDSDVLGDGAVPTHHDGAADDYTAEMPDVEARADPRGTV